MPQEFSVWCPRPRLVTFGNRQRFRLIESWLQVTYQQGELEAVCNLANLAKSRKSEEVFIEITQLEKLIFVSQPANLSKSPRRKAVHNQSCRKHSEKGGGPTEGETLEELMWIDNLVILTLLSQTNCKCCSMHRDSGLHTVAAEGEEPPHSCFRLQRNLKHCHPILFVRVLEKQYGQVLCTWSEA